MGKCLPYTCHRASHSPPRANRCSGEQAFGQANRCLGSEAKVLVAKFVHEDKPEMVNYVAFSNTIDPYQPVSMYK